MNEETGKKPFGKREWLFLIVLLVLGQLIVHMVSWRFASNASALGYISFGGMIVSIVLAVIAIIYGFVQTGEQSRASSTIASQITSLYGVVETFQKSGGVLSEQLQELGNISAGIGKAVALSEKSQEQMIKVQSSVEEVRDLVAGGTSRLSKGEDQEKKKESIPTKASQINRTEVTEEYLCELTIIPAIILFGIVVANKKGERDRDTIARKFFTDLYAEVVHPGGKTKRGMELFLEGFFIGVVRALPQFISSREKEIIMNEEFGDKLRKRVRAVKLTDIWGKIQDRLIELDGKEAAPAAPPAAAPAAPATPAGPVGPGA